MVSTTTEQVIKVVVILSALAVLLYILYDYNTRTKQRSSEEFDELLDKDLATSPQEDVFSQPDFVPSDPQLKSVSSVEQSSKQRSGPSDCFPRDRLTTEDLLPKGAANNKWSQVNPAGQGDVKDQNFLNAGFHIGINTIGTTLRNANRQIRSEVPNPQLNVSPWNQTTIEPDVNRKPLEIGGDLE